MRLDVSRLTRFRLRRPALVFHLLVAVGILVGTTTTIAEIVDRSPVQLGAVRDSRQDGVSRVQVLADNTSETVAYCIEVRVGAFDAEGLDLQAEVVAEPRQGGGRLRPGQSVNFVAEMTDISDRAFREEFDEFVAYVAERERC